jgi:hypothetical protein
MRMPADRARSLGRVSTTQDIADACLFLLSDQALVHHRHRAFPRRRLLRSYLAYCAQVFVHSER